MKKFVYLFAALLVVSSLSLTSCKSKKKVKAPEGETEVIVPCSGEDYWSNGKVFRANAVGESSDQAVSKKKAMSNARADLASSIQTTIKGTIDNYVNSREFNNREEVQERFEGLTREVINQQLNNVQTICEKQYTTAEKNYKTYIALEMTAEDLMNAMNSALTKDERLRIDYDYEKFKAEFEKEMDKLNK
jgi:hypothetical protein